jgi:hypothetical protein
MLDSFTTEVAETTDVRRDGGHGDRIFRRSHRYCQITGVDSA